MAKKIISLFSFIQEALASDVKTFRSKFFLFLFNILPDLYLLSPLKNLLLCLGGAKLPVFGVYIKSPFICSNLSNLEMGKGNFINTGAYIDAGTRVKIGIQNQIGPYLVITTNNHDILNEMKNISLPVTIGDHSWLGASVILNPGVRLANNIIVGSGGVVSANLTEENALYAGVPAKFKKKISSI